MKNKYIIVSIIFFLFLCASSNNLNQLVISSESYVTGDDGMVRIYVNILGHVNKPGVYLVYESIDIFSLLALAGGPLPGANLKKVNLFHEDKIKYLDVKESFKTGDNNGFVLYPHSTIYVGETVTSTLFSHTMLINSALQLINIYFLLK